MTRVLAICVIVTGLVALAASQSIAQRVPADAGRKETAFPHGAHVHKNWWVNADPTSDPETAQDCRGCHVFQGEHDVRALSPELCVRCHVAGPRQFRRPDEGDAAARVIRFPHHEHLALECRTCHGPTSPGARTDRIPDVMPVPTGVGAEYCASCHENDVTVHVGRPTRLAPSQTRSFSAGEMRKKLVAGIHGTDIDRTTPRFRHADHLAPEALLAGAASHHCRECHTQAGPGSVHPHLAAVPFDTGVCSKCHQGSVRFETRIAPRTSPTDGTFPHHAHEGVLDCSACHTFDAASGPAGTFRLSERFSKGYGACIECHTDRIVPDHGRLSNCIQCHAIHELDAPDFALWTDRPRATHLRPAVDAFAFATHAHVPLGTAKECADCHRRDPGAHARPIEGRAFDHASHLPSGPAAAASCTVCHADMARHTGVAPRASRSREVSDAHVAAYREPSCVTCHGATPHVVEGRVEPHHTLVFSHADHVGKSLGGRAMDCFACHAAARDAAGRMHFPATPEAASCRACHGHGDAPVARPAGFTLHQARQCGVCHAVGVPGPDMVVEVERRELSRQVGKRAHPTSLDSDCRECHRRDPALAVARGPSAAPPGVRWTRGAERVLATTELPPGRATFSPHSPEPATAAQREALGLKGRFENVLPAPEAVGTNCLPCHWADTGKQSRHGNVFSLGDHWKVRQEHGRPLLEPWFGGIDLRRP